ncbi:hypothetical protein MRQ86_13260 [Streptomyces sp. MMS21 TC-5]|uniref:hypothetical protein n=1 Tax=Streptomyces TaxID=1883 RepID=UPI0006B0696A|nr:MULTISPECIES: hypothetical protein [unclassified Streptomyces]KOU79202.1 hypothetical protein ADK94_31225 [Streptomyces sp. XY593]MCI4081295.1 hypothetical protein [Streptomyces sp. MMS21 TC-5]
MRVFVDRVAEDGRVAFRCTDGHGSAVAHWMGDRLPAPGTDTFVELTLPGPLTEWGPALPPAVSGLEIGPVGPVAPAGVLVTGEVLGVGGPGDPVVELSIGTDVVLVEVTGEESGLEIGGRISFGPARLEVYPYGL